MTGEIIVKPGVTLDHEDIRYYDVSVIAGDEGSPPRLTEHRLIVRILDVNDNAPKFNQCRYEVTKDEGVSNFITQVFATDKDENDFGKIEFEITQGK